MHPKLLCQVDDGADDDGRLRIGIERTQEIHVNFQHIKNIVLDVVQRGVPAAEVVHPDLVACCTKPRNFPLQECFIMIQCSLRDLDVEHLTGHVIAQADILDRLYHVHQAKVRPGKIH